MDDVKLPFKVVLLAFKFNVVGCAEGVIQGGNGLVVLLPVNGELML